MASLHPRLHANRTTTLSLTAQAAPSRASAALGGDRVAAYHAVMTNEGKRSSARSDPAERQQARVGAAPKQDWVNGRAIFLVAITIAAFGVTFTALDASQFTGPSILDFGSSPASTARASAAPTAPAAVATNPADEKPGAQSPDREGPGGVVHSNLPEQPPIDPVGVAQDVASQHARGPAEPSSKPQTLGPE